MLRVFCLGSLGITVEDLYLIDPDPDRGGHERGVRVELRLLDPRPWRGSPNASQPVIADRAVWRADFLESVAGGPGTKDRMHHHPGMADNEPGRRVFLPALTADPMGWLEQHLLDVLPLLEAAEVDPAPHRPSAEALREATPEIVGTVTTVLTRVREGALATSPTSG
ncbi:hypothetical protein [Actinomadura rubrisoli]|uniref:Uncharacterized protein n=1 Tax=Actinomadura rubrisoli TaxID=2530368 RepID=A0A4R5BHU1_9ACTN|nr:hypothetical protein [Actinomadura rubrisoli]TDD86081.1 hypothetical protein E1298_17945 [Actinomadura rubrisoli]